MLSLTLEFLEAEQKKTGFRCIIICTFRSILSTLRDDSQVFKTGAAGAQISQVFSPFSGQKLVSNMHYFSSHGGVLCLLPNGILEGVA